MPKTIRLWQRDIHNLAKEKGWWETERNIPEVLCLIHSEISEALEEYRTEKNITATDYILQDNGKPVGFAVELADAIIRILDLAESLNIDIEHIIALKHDYNKTRNYRHGGKNA